MSATPNPLHGVEALLFDVFGTVVDWQGSVARELAESNISLADGTSYSTLVVLQGIYTACARPAFALVVDWTAFATEWREGYYAATCVLLIW